MNFKDHLAQFPVFQEGGELTVPFNQQGIMDVCLSMTLHSVTIYSFLGEKNSKVNS